MTGVKPGLAPLEIETGKLGLVRSVCGVRAPRLEAVEELSPRCRKPQQRVHNIQCQSQMAEQLCQQAARETGTHSLSAQGYPRVVSGRAGCH